MNLEKEIKILNIDDILPNRFQPRIQFNDQKINELADSIREHGVIQPIVVRRISDKYEIIAGERRYKASIIAGKSTIPAIIVSLDDKDSAEIALIENVQRQDLTPIEEAISYKKILDMGYINQTDLAKKLGKTQSTIANKLRLLNLSDEVQDALLLEKISERHARSLLKLDQKSQNIMLNRIINERLTVRRTDEEIAKMLENMKEKKEEENFMNEKITNEFNIPTSPIIEDVVSPLKEQNEIEIPDLSTVNPGFMDISKIEETAEDLFKEPVSVDMDKLLTEDKQIKEINESTKPIEEEKPVQGGRFFTMFNLNQNPDFVENVEKEQTNMDFGVRNDETAFNPFFKDSTPEQIIENINVEEEKEEQPSFDFEPIHSMPSFSTNEDVEEQPKDDIKNQLEPEISQQMEKPIDIAPSFEEKKVEEQPFNPFSSFNIEDTLNTIENTKSVDTMMQPSPNLEEPFETKINAASLNDSVQFNEPEKVEIPNINPIYTTPFPNLPEETELEVRMEKNDEQAKPELREIINLIRLCSSQIESLGYKVDLDEIDLPDSYNVSFKIEK